MQIWYPQGYNTTGPEREMVYSTIFWVGVLSTGLKFGAIKKYSVSDIMDWKTLNLRLSPLLAKDCGLFSSCFGKEILFSAKIKNVWQSCFWVIKMYGLKNIDPPYNTIMMKTLNDPTCINDFFSEKLRQDCMFF